MNDRIKLGKDFVTIPLEPPSRVDEEPPTISAAEAAKRYAAWREAEKKKPKSVCDCIQRLRNYRNIGLHYFLRTLEVDVVEPLGVFGVTTPDEDDILDAFMTLESDFNEYADYCPWIPDENAVKLARAMEKFQTQDFNIGAFLDGEYDVNVEDFKQAAEAFTHSALLGIVRNVQGHRDTRGPLSNLDGTRLECSNRLFELADEIQGQNDKQETISAYMSPPVESVQEVAENEDEVHSGVYNYLSLCKPWEHPTDMNAIEDLIGASLPSMRQSVEWMLKLNEERAELYKAATKEELDKAVRIDNSVDHHAYEALLSAANHAALSEEFLESEWFQACGRLEWAESIKQQNIGTQYQMVLNEKK